ncbi:MAG: aminoacyl-histidine dipeptidase [Lachnospiraceae bacterium]|jgi:dipeptidase D|nr:aminoacyl-histidine dipeptidase [Lachnospiraceae bacterium]
MAVLENYEPKKVFQYFEELSAIPHGTFNTKEISDYLVDFAKAHNLTYHQDEANNVIIYKAGTAGYENSEPVIIQGHIDMVCEKRPGSNHDFKKDPLELFVEDGYVKAKDTTLGADDGIAVAMTMALLDSTDVPHPPIEAFFTVDEEVGMGGAHAADLSLLKGHKLINIDSEEEGYLTTGCAGGVRISSILDLHREEKSGNVVMVKIHGLTGGHSGAEIHEQRGNAHKMMGRFLNALMAKVEFQLMEVGGGSADNVIAMEDTARMLVKKEDVATVSAFAKEMKNIFDDEFMGDEPGLQVDFADEGQQSVAVMTKEETEKAVRYLTTVMNGVQSYSRKLEGLVQTSLNMGRIACNEKEVIFYHMIRSSVNTEKDEIRERVEALAALVGARTEIDSEYPAWEYRPESELRKVMEEEYEKMYKEKPIVLAIHAGLECGLFLGKRPDFDCVSIGPNMFDVHSFNERLEIESTERTYEYLKKVLAALK